MATPIDIDDVSNSNVANDTLRELWKKIGEIKVGMFTTWHDEKVLHSRPMTAIEVDVDGYLWFFSSLQSDLVLDVSVQPNANINFSEPKDNFYVSLAGRAEFIIDRAQYEKLWSPLFKPWFPRGVDDPDLVLIRFDITDAMYWDSDINRMVKWAKLLTAAATGNRPDLGEHGHIRFH